MAGEFWLSDTQWTALEEHLPRNQPGARRTNDRRVISGIVHMLKNGGRWQDCPGCRGPPTTIDNRITAGRSAAFGWRSSPRWPRPARAGCR
jgi:transposase